MRARDLKGIHKTTARLADGSKAVYFYAWKGGPRLRGKRGSPDFIASYLEACEKRPAPMQDKLQSVFDAYQRSQRYLGRAPRTQFDYGRKIKAIAKKFGDFPLSGPTDRRTRGIFLAWRDELAATSQRQADYHFQVLALMLSWALDRGLVAANPCEKAERVYSGTRVDKVWTDADVAAFLARAPQHLHLPLYLAKETAQRQGDLLRLPWSAYDGTHIRLRQGKTGARVAIPVSNVLKAALESTPKRSTLILTNSDGKPWTANGFSSSWRKACAAAGVIGVTFHDLRGTAVTRLAIAGCTSPEIASITGHSLRDVGAILDAHYLHRDPALAESAIAKLDRLETGTKSPKRAPKRATEV
jgi:integrase